MLENAFMLAIVKTRFFATPLVDCPRVWHFSDVNAFATPAKTASCFKQKLIFDISQLTLLKIINLFNIHIYFHTKYEMKKFFSFLIYKDVNIRNIQITRIRLKNTLDLQISRIKKNWSVC